MAASMHNLSRELVWWEVTTEQSLAGATAEVAILAAGETPAELDWVPANLTEEAEGEWWVSILVSGEGQGGDITLAVGDWQSWIRLSASTERLVRQPGIVTIT